MNGDFVEIAARLAAALAVGGLIGLERSYHGRPAGFRTHALVCLAKNTRTLSDALNGTESVIGFQITPAGG